MDHVAVVSERAWDNVIRYSRDLGGRWIGGPDNDPSSDAGDDFYFCQVSFDGGTRIEILEPIPGDGSDFLRRFLARNGPGPHHFTFKTPDFADTVGALANADTKSSASTRTARHGRKRSCTPRTAGHGDPGCLGGGEGWDDAPPLPPTRHVSTTKIATVVHLVADVQAAADLFDGPLGMERTDEWKDPNIGTGVDLRSGPWNLKLIQPTDANLAHWMGNRPGRLRALHFQLDDPSLVPDAQRVGARGGEQQDAMFIVPPEHNLGVRLLLTEHS